MNSIAASALISCKANNHSALRSLLASCRHHCTASHVTWYAFTRRVSRLGNPARLRKTPGLLTCHNCCVQHGTRSFHVAAPVYAAKAAHVIEENGNGNNGKNGSNNELSGKSCSKSSSESNSETKSSKGSRKIPIDFITMFDSTSRTTHAFKVGEDKHVTMFHPNPNHRVRHINLEGMIDSKDWIKADSVGRDGSGAGVASRPVRELEWKAVPELSTGELLHVYKRLAKFRLTGLVVITTMAGYVIAPGAFDLLPFVTCCVGTGLTSASANTINQFFEVPFDAQMSRTRDRPLVTGVITPLHALGFATVCSLSGLSMLYWCVNPLTAALGVFNLGMYTLAYTPMKRYSIANTWVGSVVGAIPPMMGWAASTGALEPGAWLLGAILFAWQFPHFNSLSWNLRPDYSRAGYRMMSVTDPALCKRVALRYSLGLIGLCSLAPLLDVTTWFFAFTSLPPNAYMAYLAYRFYKEGDSNSSRSLFRMTLVHIPIIMLLMIFDKKGFAPDVFSCDTCKALAVFGKSCSCSETTDSS